MSKHSTALFSLLACVLVAPGAARANLDIVATVPDLAAIAKDIGGDRVSVISLALPTQDPHFVDAKPSYTLALNKADLLLAVGLDLELGWLPTLQTGARNPKVQVGGDGFLECGQHVDKLEVPTGPVDRSMGDIHPHGNPHYLYDPRAAAACARAVAAKMAELDSANAALYRTRLQAFVERLKTKQADWEKRMAKFHGSPVVGYHRSWAYLLSWLDLVEVINLEPKPGISPSPRHVAQVIGVARKKGAKVIIQEDFYPNKTGVLVAGKIGGRVVSIPGGTDFKGGQTYIEHMEEVVSMLEHGLGQ